MEERATTTPRTATSDTDPNILLYVIVAAVILFFVMSKRNREPEVVIPPTKEELRVIRERRTQAMSRKFLPHDDDDALLDESEEAKREKPVGKAHEKATAVSKSAPMPPSTTEKDTTTLRRGKPQNPTVEIVDTSNEGTVPVEDSQESTPIVEEGEETATTQAERAPVDSEMKRKQVAQTSVEKEASTETMVDEKKAPVNKKVSESRLLQTNGGPKAEQGSKKADENPKALKDPPPVKKRPRRTLPPPQLAADILSSITKQEIVVSCDGKEYRPRKNAGKSTVKVSMEAGATLDSVQLPRLPKQFRDIAAWYARAYATSRNGYPPHVSIPSDAGYEAFQSMLTTLMDRLVQRVFDSLQSDQTAVEDDDDDEDDLFSDYVQPAQQQQESGPILSFLALLEETPSIMGRPFLESLLKKSSETDLASILLHRALQRLDNLSSMDLISQRSNAVSALLQSPTAVKAWAKRFQQEAANKDKDAKDKEASSWLKPLLQACAHCIPEAGAEQPNHAASLFRKDIEKLDKFPVCIYDNRNKDVGLFMQQAQLQMQSSRNVAEVLLRKGGKDNMFRWLGQIIQSNDAMASLLRGDLLATNGVAAVLASRSFLLGLASAVVNVCCESLTGLFEKDRNAFDHRYLQHGRLDVAREEHMLVQNKNDVAAKEERKFSGGTEFFFLACGLLRISLYPALRIEGAFHQQYQRVFSSIHQAAQESKDLPPQALSVAKSAMAALMGWKTYMDDPKLVATLTKFAILQLQWVLTQKDQFELIPEWMLKNPATWLANIARTQSRLLKPYQATVVVEVATQLLQLGTKANDERALSPVVIDHLVKIIAAFVSAGVNKAKQRQRRRGGDDDRDASIYLSFDANDLGVTVFTNKLVATELCPTLMQTFGAVDVVEGLDVDREHGFDKFSAKGTIAELILRLWSHPNGECRASITKMDAARVAQFAKETVIATGVLFDFSCNRMADICNGSKRPFRSQQDRAFLEGQGRSVCSELTFARLWIMTLCKISEEPRIRKILGNASVAKDLAALIIHLVDILTDPDGGIHPNLDFAPVRSSELATKVDSMDANEKQKHAASISKSRYVSRVLYGLDVSLLCHQFLAMLSGWHKAARDSGGLSPILKAFAAHDDYEEGRYRNILRRLIAESSPVQGTEAESAAAIFEHDGYVDTSPWEGQYKDALPKSSDVENQIRSSKKDQMSHEEMRVLASMDDMKSFLDDAESYRKVAVGTTNSVATIPPEKLDETVDSILAAGGSATAETYAEQLSDWVVTSESFASKHDPSKFAHYYDSTVRTRGVACSGKTMVKEARRCHKNLPVPHPNSAAFCCFAEERMDLCRACITGPVDTPYALGIFLFEVFFPANYPTIPPLVTFMTTGGGQTRFNPNLYSDGKVCLSLLGTFHAQDESQKWNPGYSSLGQILLSIQTQLLVEEPYFNEPGNEARRGTPVGTESANRYNLVLKLATLRHAIISPLKEPPVGLEEICLRHFSLCRGRILVQAQRWMKEAQEMKSTLYPRFQRSYAELVALLAALGNDMPSLPPSEDEKAAAKKAPAGVIRRVQVGGTARHVRVAARQVRAAPAQEVTEVSLAAALMTAASVLAENPWANPGAANAQRQATTKTTADDDDELYE